MVLSGVAILNPLLVIGGFVVSQISTGKIINKTNQAIMMHPEQGNMGEAYFGAESTVFSQWDGNATPGPNSKITKTFRFSDATIVERNGEIVTELSLGTKVVNGIANFVKRFSKDEIKRERYQDYYYNEVKKTGNPRGVKGWIEHAELTPDGENYFKNGVDE